MNLDGKNYTSWSVYRVGKNAAVAATIAKDFADIICPEPAQTIKNSVAAVVATALAALPPALAVNVRAGGGQYALDSKKPTELNLKISLELSPLPGFVDDAPAGPERA